MCRNGTGLSRGEGRRRRSTRDVWFSLLPWTSLAEDSASRTHQRPKEPLIGFEDRPGHRPRLSSVTILAGQLGRAGKTEIGSSILHRPDTELDVLVEIDSEFPRAVFDVFAAYRAREGFVLQLLPNRLQVNFGDALRGLNVRYRGKEAGQFIAGEECLFQQAVARDAAVVRVREDGAANVFGDAALGEDRLAFHRMFA